MRRLALAAALLCGTSLAIPAPAGAQVFRWANDGDVNSMDPYGRNETFLLSFNSNIYEPLVRRNKEMLVEPALAERWEQPSPTVWRFHLRQGVKFTDGTPFTADDVVFSAQRVRAQGSNLQAVLASVKEIRKVDDQPSISRPPPPIPSCSQELTTWGIMSQGLGGEEQRHQAGRPDPKEENFATRNAMGTGPFRLVSREPDRKTVLDRNPDWWDKPTDNIERAELNIIANDATRVAALLSGEVDFVYTVPPQDMERIGSTAGVRIIQGRSCARSSSAWTSCATSCSKSDVKGKNPLQGRARAPGVLPGDRRRGDPARRSCAASRQSDRR